MFQVSPFAIPSASNIFCGLGWDANTIYRELQATTTESSTACPLWSFQGTRPVDRIPRLMTIPGSSWTLSTTMSRTIPSSTTTTALRAADLQASQSLTPTATPSESASRAWIAGAVIGTLAGVAIVALVAWLIHHWKQKSYPRYPKRSCWKTKVPHKHQWDYRWNHTRTLTNYWQSKCTNFPLLKPRRYMRSAPF